MKKFFLVFIFILLPFYCYGDTSYDSFSDWVNEINSAINALPDKITNDNLSANNAIDNVLTKFPLNYEDYCFNQPFDIVMGLAGEGTYTPPAFASIPDQLTAEYYKDKEKQVLDKYHEIINQLKQAQDNLAKKKFVDTLTILKLIIEYLNDSYDIISSGSDPDVLDLLQKFKDMNDKAKKDAEDLTKKLQALQDEKAKIKALENIRDDLVNSMYFLRNIEYKVYNVASKINRLKDMIAACEKSITNGINFANTVKNTINSTLENVSTTSWSAQPFISALSAIKNKFANGELRLGQYLSKRDEIISQANSTFNSITNPTDTDKSNFNDFKNNVAHTSYTVDDAIIFDQDIMSTYNSTREQFTSTKNNLIKKFQEIREYFKNQDDLLKEYADDLNLTPVKSEQFDYMQLIKNNLYNANYLNEENILQHITLARDYIDKMFNSIFPSYNKPSFWQGSWVSGFFVAPFNKTELQDIYNNIAILEDDIKDFPYKYYNALTDLKENIDSKLAEIETLYNSMMSYESNKFIYASDFEINSNSPLLDGDQCNLYLMAPLCNLNINHLKEIDVVKTLIETEFESALPFKYLLKSQANSALSDINSIYDNITNIIQFNDKLNSMKDEIESAINYLDSQYSYIATYSDSFVYQGQKVTYKIFLDKIYQSIPSFTPDTGKKTRTEALINLRSNLEQFHQHYSPKGIGDALKVIDEDVLTKIISSAGNIYLHKGDIPVLQNEELINTLKNMMNYYWPKDTYVSGNDETFSNEIFEKYLLPEQISLDFPNIKNIFYENYGKVSHYKIKPVSGNYQIGTTGYLAPFNVRFQVVDISENPPKPVTSIPGVKINIFLKVDGELIKPENIDTNDLEKITSGFKTYNSIYKYMDNNSIFWTTYTDENGYVEFKWHLGKNGDKEPHKWTLVLKIYGPTEDSYGYFYAFNEKFLDNSTKEKYQQAAQELFYGETPVDSDNDGLSDITEQIIGTNPNNSDSDNDGIPDAWEYFNGLNPDNSSDASMDSDNDSFSNLEEYQNNTSPTSSFSAPETNDNNSEDNNSDNNTTDMTQIEISSGWNLKALPVKITLPVFIFNMQGINTIWRWNNGKWEIYSPKDAINQLLSQYNIESFDYLNYGEGYWINSGENLTITTGSGEEYGIESVTINNGWTLIGIGKDMLSSEIATSFSNIKTLWKWTGNNWQIWSPIEAIMTLISNYSIEPVNELHKGDGFWVNK